jgi:hypothetical protein
MVGISSYSNSWIYRLNENGRLLPFTRSFSVPKLLPKPTESGLSGLNVVSVAAPQIQ